MARIALTWELGAGSGYISTMAALAHSAGAQGHQCVFIVRDLAIAANLLPAGLGELVQAPLGDTPIDQQVKVQISYASLLHNCGYASSAALSARLRAWQSLYTRFAIDRVMIRHSPTALLAARLMQLPVLRYGLSFTEPPDTSPWPSFRPDLQIPPNALQQNEDQLLMTINRSLRDFGATPLSTAAGLVGGTPVALLSYPELDRYARPPDVRYLGFPRIGFGAAPEWPPGDGPCVFVSMHTAQQFEQWLPLLAPLKIRCLARTLLGSVRGLSIPAHIRTFEEALDFERIAESCDVILTYGSLNLINLGLLKGKPIGVTATTPDQLMAGLAVQELGAGLLMSTMPDTGTPPMLRRLLDDATLRRAAESFAERYAGWPRDTIPQRLLDAALAAPPSGFRA